MANLREIIKTNHLVFETLSAAGQLAAELKQDIYVVGGVVRDLLLDHPLKEIDLMVIGDGIAFAQSLAERLGVKKIVPFSQFSTARIPYRQIPIEVAAARTEEYDRNSRKPSLIRYTDLPGDLLRRDFTINAMAIDLHPQRFGELHDPHGGIGDLHRRRLVTPLDPLETFAEDPVRMLRAAYFAARLGFEIEPGCRQAIEFQTQRLKIVSPERITNEFMKTLAAPRPSVGLWILQDTGLMELVFPEIAVMYGMEQPKEWHHKDVFSHTLKVVDNVAEMSEKVKLRLAALVHDIAKPVTRMVDSRKGVSFHGHDEIGARMLYKVARRMKLSNDLRDYLQKMTRLHLRPIALAKDGVTDSAVRRLMVAAGDEIDDLIMLCRADITTKNPRLVKRYMGNFERVEARMRDVEERDDLRAFQSPVRGAEIMEICNLKEGPKVGELKSAIEEAILNGEIENTYAAARAYLDRIYPDLITSGKN